MNRPMLILAAHGCREDHRVNERLAELAQCVARDGLLDDVRVAFHLGEPAFSNVLDQSYAGHAIVVPLMTSRGYFSDAVLPRELGRNARYPDMHVCITRPVGAHPGLVTLVANRVRTLLEAHHLDPADTALAVVGHGTSRHAESGRATLELAAMLQSRAVCAEVLPAFLDQSPEVATIIARTRKPVILVIPFMIGEGPHTTRDIPARLGMTLPEDVALPVGQQVDGRRMIYDRAVGADPGLVSLIISLVEEAP